MGDRSSPEDFAMIYEIGANTIRLAHYPHAPYFYELCDMYGIVVWAEIPFVDQIGGNGSYTNPDQTRANFFNTTRTQLVELIRQQYNRPSIVCWGLQNEIRFGSFEGVAQAFLNDLNTLAHQEDPTRFTTQALYPLGYIHLAERCRELESLPRVVLFQSGKLWGGCGQAPRQGSHPAHGIIGIRIWFQHTTSSGNGC